MLPPEPAGGYFCKIGGEFGWGAQYHNIGILKMQVPGSVSWAECRIVISDGFTEICVDNQRSAFEVHDGFKGAPTLFIRGRQRIDDLTVQEIRPDELPDVHEYIDALAKIPLDKRVGTVALPELTSARPGRPVTVTFSPSSNAKE